MSREDGCEKNIQYLKPLVIREPLRDWGVWWKKDGDRQEGEAR
jgi:hypothetical protein